MRGGLMGDTIVCILTLTLDVTIYRIINDFIAVDGNFIEDCIIQ